MLGRVLLYSLFFILYLNYFTAFKACMPSDPMILLTWEFIL